MPLRPGPFTIRRLMLAVAAFGLVLGGALVLLRVDPFGEILLGLLGLVFWGCLLTMHRRLIDSPASRTSALLARRRRRRSSTDEAP